MKNLKKIVALGMVAMLLMTGCTNKKADETTTSSTPTATPSSSSGEVSQAPAAETTYDSFEKAVWFSDINFWNPPTTWTTEEGTVQGEISKHSGLTFDMNIPAEDGDTKLSLMLLNNELPDVITLTNIDMIKQLVASGLVWDLDEFLKTYDPQSHLLQDYPEDAKQAAIVRDGGWYAYGSHLTTADQRKLYPPCSSYYSDGAQYGSNNAIMFNKNLMEQYGFTLDDLKTEDQLYSALDKIVKSDITVEGASVIPLLIDGTSYQDSTLSSLEMFFGAMPIGADGNYRNILLAPETKHGLKFLNNCVTKGLLDPNQFTVDNSTVKANIAAKRVFCFIGNMANTGFVETEWDTTGAILSSEGTDPVLPIGQQAGTGWMQTFISKSTKNPERVAKFLSYMSSKEGLTTCIYGFEGVDYNWDNGSLIVTEQGTEDSKNYATKGIFAYWPFHNTDFSNSVIPAPAEGTNAYASNYLRTALGKLSNTHVYDASLVEPIVNTIDPNSDEGLIQAQIKNYKEAQIAVVIMSNTDAEFDQNYQDMVDKFNKLGIDKLNAAYDKGYKSLCDQYGTSLTDVNAGKY